MSFKMSLAMQNQPPVSHIFDQWLLDVLLDTPSKVRLAKVRIWRFAQLGNCGLLFPIQW